MNFKFLSILRGKFNWGIILGLIFLMSSLHAQHNWVFDPHDYNFNGELAVVILINSSEVSTGTLGAFVGDECRGYIDGSIFPLSGKTVFTILCYSNQAAGEMLTFRYYDDQADEFYSVEETLEFVSNMIIGSADAPLQFHGVDNAANDAPVADNPIEVLKLQEGFIFYEIDLDTIFSDPEGDDLFYSVVISDTSIAQVNIAGSYLNIIEKKPGEAYITVSASDGALTVDDGFNLSIVDINDPPVIAAPIEDIDLNEGFHSIEVDISGVFEDPEGDDLSYSVVISDTSIAQVNIAGSYLNIIEKKPGEAYITVTASDGALTVDDGFNLSIVDINDPPTFDCYAIPDTSFVVGFGTYTITDLCSKFFDEELDPLTFSVTSSNMSVATVAFIGCDLVLTEVGIGTSTIQFCASDGFSHKCCSFEFSVIEENEIVLKYDGKVIQTLDSIMICSEASEFIIDVKSDVTWGFETYSEEWIQYEIIDNSTFKISCLENTTGEWRMGLVKVFDIQEHEVLFYVYQTKDCVPENVVDPVRNNVICYPNPVDDVLNIDINYIRLDTKTNFFISDICGRIVKIEKVVLSNGNHVKIKMSDVKSGIYFIRFVDQTGASFNFPVVRK